ncbi:MAG: hypothetical protein AAB479_00860 [Patescibacteria group bacterium]
MSVVQNLPVAVMSGLSYAGKSHYISLLQAQHALADFAPVSADSFRGKMLGDGPVTQPVIRLFQEAVWLEIKRILVVERKPVMLEMVIKTVLDHWRPLTGAVTDAHLHLMSMAQELRGKGQECPDFLTSLRVVTFFCNATTLERRIKKRMAEVRAKGNVTGTNIFDLQFRASWSGAVVVRGHLGRVWEGHSDQPAGDPTIHLGTGTCRQTSSYGTIWHSCT